MFERPHHRRIAQVLTFLDGELLEKHHCLFGGGTAIALSHGEYRQSVDIDFLVSDVGGYRALRQLVSEPAGILGLMALDQELVRQARPVRADQYGLRTAVIVEEERIKFEIVLEGRITLESPNEDERICGVSRLSPVDLVATKLLANSDRQADPGVFNRDVIDLAMMAPPKKLLQLGKAKAETAYGAAISKDVVEAIRTLETREGWFERCLERLQITLPPAVVWSKVRDLRKRWRRVSGT